MILREPYVDRSRIGAFGKDYGGYITSLLVSTKESPVKCAAVLSPITDFELYGELLASHAVHPRREIKASVDFTRLCRTLVSMQTDKEKTVRKVS